MAIEELKGIFRPVTIRREKDGDPPRRNAKRPPPPKKEEKPDPGKGKVDIQA